MALLARPSRARLSSLARGGTASIVAGAVFNNGLRIVSSMTLTRLLSAEAFGVVGVVMSLQVILVMLSDVGLYPFIVRHADASDRRFLDEVWTLRLGRSLALTAIMATVAWPASELMGKPALAPVLALSGGMFLLEGFSSLTFATAVREQKLWRLTFLESCTAALQLVISVGIALWLRSSWSLVIAMLLSTAVRAVFSYTMFPGAGRRLRVSRARARELWTFSRFIAMSSFLSLLILQSDKLVLARLMPLDTYGHYIIAATLASAPMPLALSYAQRVLYPAFTRAAHDADLPAVFYSKRRVATLLYMFSAGGLAGSAGLVVALLYDPRYSEVSHFLRLLAISTAVYLPAVTAEEAMVASGLPRWTFYAAATRACWLAAGGVAALLTRDMVLLIAVVGTVEVAALACLWVGLVRVRVFSLPEELLGLGAAAGGAAIGWAMSFAAAGLF